ncbi:MAG TPA: putative glycoside hydrolase [Gaiellaceae bacterium]
MALALAAGVSALSTTSDSGSEGFKASARSTAHAVVDRRPYPRTLSFAKCGYDAELAKRDMVVGAAYCDIAKLRKLDPNGIFLVQPGLFPGSGGNGYGGMSVTYGAGLYYWRPGYTWPNNGCDNLPGGVALGCIRAFDPNYDWLRSADGQIVRKNGASGPPGWNLADPTGKGTRELVAKFMAYTAKLDGLYAKGWDGVFSDNWIYGVIGATYFYGSRLDTDRDGKVDDYTTLRKQWDDGLNEVASRLQSYLPGKLVVGNGNLTAARTYYGGDPTGWLKSANGTMVEAIERYYNSPAALLNLSSRWLDFGDGSEQPRYLLYLQNALTDSGQLFTGGAGADPNDSKLMLDPAVMRSMRWGFTLALMSGAYYEIVLNNDHGVRWWYDEYDGGLGIRRRGYLGLPRGDMKRLLADVYRRDFQHGIAINNSSRRAVTVKLRSRYRHLRGTQDTRVNNGKLVTQVTVPAHDGVVLVDVGRRSK